ncbi:MAG: tripartite tricarboxylate transporter TctB family protein [Beijerinckiaceae bacterium]|nr:tripartite tricarboxylate transporter TctB family protein [Beijerinckiaceae bacterium]
MKAMAKNPMTIAMLAIFVVMVGIASTYPAGARFMPFVVGVPAILLCLLQLVLDVRAAKVAPREKDRRNEFEIAEERMSQMTGRTMTFEAARMAPEVTVSENPTGIAEAREWLVWTYILALIAGILFFGYTITIPLFILLFLRWEAKCSWLKAALYSGVGSFILLFMFAYGLKFQLHQGFVTERVMGFFV